jgi:hypothetical protein
MNYGTHPFNLVCQASKQVAGVVALSMLMGICTRNRTERTTP